MKIHEKRNEFVRIERKQVDSNVSPEIGEDT